MFKKLFFLFIIGLSALYYGQSTGLENYIKSGVSIPDEILTKFGFSETPYKGDTDPQFPGGMPIFRMKLAENFDAAAIETQGRVSTTVYIVIEDDGTVSDIASIGTNESFNKEAERSFKSIKSTWTPAKLNNKPIRSIYAFPISMTFE